MGQGSATMFIKKEKISTEKKQVIEEFRQHVSSGKAAFFEKYQMQFVAGDRSGCWLEDMDGQQQLFNLHCNGGVFNLGHRNPQIMRTLQTALTEVDIGNHHLMSQYRARLATDLCHSMPEPLNAVIFGVSGGEAVDVAIKVACGASGRKKIVSVFGGYHGHTGLSVQAGDEKYRAPFHLGHTNFQQVNFNDLTAMDRALDKDTAAVILETIPATLGMIMPEEDYLTTIRKWCDERDIVLILDEVQTGWGRTGKLWAFEHYHVVPDIVVLGKGMSGGIYPMSATVISDKLNQLFVQEPFSHISTFGGSELGCVVSSEVLKISASEDFLNHVNLLAEQFRQQLSNVHQKPMTGFQQKGLMMALELNSDIAGPVLTKTAYDQGLLMIYANNRPSAVQFLPPLIMQAEQIPELIERLIKALKKAKKLIPLINLKDKVKHRFSF